MLILLLLFFQSAPTQTDRGEALFLDQANGCASCHALKGKGTAVGPDLKGVARLSPKGLAMAIRSTVAQYVQTAKVKDVGTFPAYVTSQDDKTVKLFDLSKTPPEAHESPKGDVQLSGNTGWKHPPSARNYTPEQMADIIAYIRYAGAGNKATVTPDDLQ